MHNNFFLFLFEKKNLVRRYFIGIKRKNKGAYKLSSFDDPQMIDLPPLVVIALLSRHVHTFNWFYNFILCEIYFV